jgi:hypothetical protein
MWKTPGHFWAQIGPFPHILAPKTAEIHCTAVYLALFRKPYVVDEVLRAAVETGAPAGKGDGGNPNGKRGWQWV